MSDNPRELEKRHLPLEAWDEAPGESEEDVRVLRWRLEQAINLGFQLAPAALLADSKADLNVMRRLIARGCPHETAVAILL
jgi:hypothetical protein